MLTIRRKALSPDAYSSVFDVTDAGGRVVASGNLLIPETLLACAASRASDAVLCGGGLRPECDPRLPSPPFVQCMSYAR